jgi:hypothetical protein
MSVTVTADGNGCAKPGYLCMFVGRPGSDHWKEMFPVFMFGYAAAAFGFYRYVLETAPKVDEEETMCKIYELFPDRQEQLEEIRKAA